MANYYYLISTLPDLRLEKPGEIGFKEVLELITRNLTPEDKKLYQYLFYPNDNHNFIVHLLNKYQGHKEQKYLWPSVLSIDQVHSYDRQDLVLPEYLARFIADYSDQFPSLSEGFIQQELENRFLEETRQLPDDFIGKYFQFDAFLKCLAVRVNATIYPFVEGSAYCEDLPEYESMLRSSTEQLTIEYPFIDSLKETFQAKNPSEIERYVDRIRWEFIDEYNSMDRFSSAQLFGYTLKLLMLIRWVETHHPAEAFLGELCAYIRQDYPLTQITQL